MELIVMMILLLITGALILWPLLRRGEPEPVPSPAPAVDSGRAKAALGAIRELEFDFATGKISAEDYAHLRARYESRAVEAMAAVAPRPAEDLEAKLEAEIRAARSRRDCAACGTLLPTAAKFCPACGAAVSEVRR